MTSPPKEPLRPLKKKDIGMPLGFRHVAPNYETASSMEKIKIQRSMENLHLSDTPSTPLKLTSPTPRRAKRKAPPPPLKPSSSEGTILNSNPAQNTCNTAFGNPGTVTPTTKSDTTVSSRPAPPPSSTKPLLTNYFYDETESSPDELIYPSPDLQNQSKMQHRLLTVLSLPTLLPSETRSKTETKDGVETRMATDVSTVTNENSRIRVMPGTTINDEGANNSSALDPVGLKRDREEFVSDRDEDQRCGKYFSKAINMGDVAKLVDGGNIDTVINTSLVDLERKGLAKVDIVGRNQVAAFNVPTSLEDNITGQLHDGVVLREKRRPQFKDKFEVHQGTNEETSLGTPDEVFEEFLRDGANVFQTTSHSFGDESKVRDSTFEAFEALDAAILSHSCDDLYQDTESLNSQDGNEDVQISSTEINSSETLLKEPDPKPPLTERPSKTVAGSVSENKPVPKPAPRRFVPSPKTPVSPTLRANIDRNGDSQFSPTRTAPRPVTRKAFPPSKEELNVFNADHPKTDPVIQLHIPSTNDDCKKEGNITENEVKNCNEADLSTRSKPETVVKEPTHHATSNTLASHTFQTIEDEISSNTEIANKLEESSTIAVKSHFHTSAPKTVEPLKDETSSREDPAEILNKEVELPKYDASMVDNEDVSDNNVSLNSPSTSKGEKVENGTSCGERLNWDPNKYFAMDDIEDPEMKRLFKNAGVTDEELQDPDTRQFIYNFLLNHGGMEAVRREAHFKATLRLNKRQPRTQAPKERLAKKTFITYL